MKTKIHREDPALTFISAAAEQDADNQTDEVPVRMKLNHDYIEVKTKRVQLVMQPSVYKRAKTAAKTAGLSFNEYVHRLLDQATQGGKNE
jgi:predicted DNA binding CopG/RHH family protein